VCAYCDGQRDGQRILIKYLLTCEEDVSISVKKQKIYKLTDIEKGIFFSIIDDDVEIKEPLNKYLKLISSDYGTTVFNMTLGQIELIKNDTNVILYSCKAIYTPKLEKNEDTQ
jgi:hypothetical protein